MPVEREVIRSNISQKGFELAPDGDHDYYWLYMNGKKTKWWIKLSRGSNYRVYSDNLLKRQAKTLRVTFRQLVDFVTCKTKKQEFYNILCQNDSFNCKS